jgi:hypothetical protein
MVSVPATGPMVRGFIPAEGDEFLRAINSFGGKVKSSAHVVRFGGMLKRNLRSMIEILHKAKLISLASSSCFATKLLCWCITRELWWKNLEFFMSI